MQEARQSGGGGSPRSCSRRVLFNDDIERAKAMRKRARERSWGARSRLHKTTPLGSGLLKLQGQVASIHRVAWNSFIRTPGAFGSYKARSRSHVPMGPGHK